MAFRCDKCGNSQEAGTKPVRVVTETRDREYEHHDRRDSFVKLSRGHEIVRMEDHCPPCAGIMVDDEVEGMRLVADLNQGAA